MKRILFSILLFFMCFGLTSCKNEEDSSFGDVDFHFSGFYLEFYDDQNYQVGYKNPCAYYHHKSDTFKLDSGNVPNMGYFSFTNSSKNIVNQDGLTVFVLYTTIVVPSNGPDSVKVYIIKESSNGTCYVDTDMVDMIDLTERGSYTANYEYRYNEVGYRFQFVLGYYKNGVN